MTRQEIVDMHGDEELLFLDPPSLDAAIIGVASSSPGRPCLVCYDRNKVINLMADQDGMTLEMAEEHFSFNALGAWMGDRTPVFVEITS